MGRIESMARRNEWRKGVIQTQFREHTERLAQILGESFWFLFKNQQQNKKQIQAN
jgi:hypothetical protein